MALPRLVSARWLGNHGVSLRDSRGGTACVPPDGALTVGQVSKLLRCLPIQVYRLVGRGVLHFRRRNGVAMVRLSELRRRRRETRS
jgi:hypothetical protein